MVSVGLYTRSVIPTIRSVTGIGYSLADEGYSGTTTSASATPATGSGYVHITVPDGDTCFASLQIYNFTYNTTTYGSIRSSEDLTLDLCSVGKTHGGVAQNGCEYKNTTGAPTTLRIYQWTPNGTVKSRWCRILFMNDSDLAKWEVVNCPTTRYRKYAVDKYYMLAKYNSGSFNIDGYAVSTTTGGIVEVPVETIVSSTALTGSGTQFFQITGQGFTVTP